MQNNLFYKIDSYKKINVIFSLLIIFIFFYCFLTPYLSIKFASSCEGMPKIYCKSRGLTRSFSEILRLNFDKAILFNSFGIKIFTFFLVQFFARIFITIIINETNFKTISTLDIALSFLYFIVIFYNLVIPN